VQSRAGLRNPYPRPRAYTQTSNKGFTVGVPSALVAEKVKHQLLCGSLGRQRGIGAAIGLNGRPFLALLALGRGGIGTRLLLRLGRLRRLACRLLLSERCLLGGRLIAQELAEPLDRALLERALVDLAVLDEGTCAAAVASEFVADITG